MSKKTIRCLCHGALAASPTALTPWEDVWIEWKGKPGRKTYRASPCLICVAELEADMWMHEHIRNEQERPDWYRDEDDDIRRAIADVQRMGYGLRGGGAGLEIVTGARGINRKEAERMLAWYLAANHDIYYPKFSWQRPEIVVESQGFGNYSRELFPDE